MRRVRRDEYIEGTTILDLPGEVSGCAETKDYFDAGFFGELGTELVNHLRHVRSRCHNNLSLVRSIVCAARRDDDCENSDDSANAD